MKKLISLIASYPLISVTLAFILGITISVCHIWSLPLPLVFFFSITFLLFSYFTLKILGIRTVFLLTFFFTIGIYAGIFVNTPPKNPSHIYNLIKEKQEVLIIGTLKEVEGFNGEASRVILETAGIRYETSPHFSPAVGKIMLKFKNKWPHEILPGDRIIVRSLLKHPQGYRTPGSFDYPRFLARKNIWVTGFIKSALFIQKTHPPHSLVHRLRYLPQRIRVHLRDTIDASLSHPENALYKALLTGDRSGIDRDVLEQFKGSGCMHLLAISGLHLSLLGTFLYFSISWLFRRSEWLILHCNIKKLSAFFCILPLAGYTLVAGANPPVVRSLFMALTVIFALCTDRQKSFFTMISFAAIILVGTTPPILFSASFQLTFAAVISIAVIFPFLSKLFFKEDESTQQDPTTIKKMLRWIYAAFAVSAAATIGTAPLLLYYFNRISLVGPIANLIIEPLLCFWSLPFGFAGSSFLFISPTISSILFNIGSLGLTHAINAAYFFNALPFSNVWLPPPSLYMIFVYYGTITALILSRYTHKVVFNISCVMIAICVLLFIHPIEEFLKVLTKDTTLTFLDVGNGSSTFIELPKGQRVLIDGGGLTSPRFNVGKQVIAPFLWHKGITKIDSVILTHPDSDHFNGLPFILERFKPQVIWTNSLHGHNHSYKKLLTLARKLKIEIKIPFSGEMLLNTNKIKITSIHNPYNESNGHSIKHHTSNSNDGSLLIYLTDDDFSVLFPGDISKRVESMLLTQKVSLQAKVLLSPHHGSISSNSEDFLRAVKPELMIVSTGRIGAKSRSGKSLSKKCEQNNIDLLSTAEAGSITISKKDLYYSVTTENSRRIKSVSSSERKTRGKKYHIIPNPLSF